MFAHPTEYVDIWIDELQYSIYDYLWGEYRTLFCFSPESNNAKTEEKSMQFGKTFINIR